MQAYTPFYSPFMPGFMSIFIPLVLVVALWTIVLKGYSLWYAARGGQKKWFIALLVVNTLGILEIIYLIWFRPSSRSSSDSPSSPETPAHHSSAQA